jgi:hypothetical protein
LNNNVNSFDLLNFKLQIPSLNIDGAVISLIVWNNNFHLSQSNTSIDTNIISISLSDVNGTIMDSPNLANPIQLAWPVSSVYTPSTTSSNTNITYTGNCFYWNTTQLNWKENGCYSVYVNKSYIICNCTHLTQFSAKINTVMSYVITPYVLPTSSTTSSNIICPPPGSVYDVPPSCLKNINMYNNFLQNKTQLQANETQQLFNNLNDQPPSDIENTIRQAGILTLNSDTNNKVQISTNNFSFVGKQLDNKQNDFQVSNFQLQVPSRIISNINNTAISMIVWTKNPYATKSTRLIDSNVISISLSNLSGGLISSQNLLNPIQLSWTISNTLSILNITNNTSILNYTGICYYWNTTYIDWKEDGCYSVYVNKTYITCNCTHLTEFSARINAVLISNVNIFSNIGNVYSEEGLIKYKNFYIIFGSMGLMVIIASIIGLLIDLKDFKRYYELLPNLIGTINNEQVIDIYLENNSNKKDKSITILVGDEKPIKYKYLSILCNRILFQHTQIGVFFKFDPKMPRLFRIILVFVGLFNSLFLTALLYGYSSYGNMSLSETFVLSLITATLNYPSLIILSLLMNYAGLSEFKWRYPLLIDELERRHKYEDEISMYKSKELDDIKISKIKKIIVEDEYVSLSMKIYRIFVSLYNSTREYCSNIFYMITCRRKIDNEKTSEGIKKGSIERAYFFATKEYIKPVLQPYYYSYLPFHTTSGCIVFFISIGWLAWCLNYLLLFASVHQSSVSDNILTSFGFTELETVFITQPISLLCVIFIGYFSKKIKNWFGFKTDIHLESIYYYSDPYKNKNSTEFSTRFAFEIFVNIPSQISYSINDIPVKIKNIGYATVESVIEYIDKDDMHFSKKSHKFNRKELSIVNLYERMRNKVKDVRQVKKIIEVIPESYIDPVLKINEVNEVEQIKINEIDKIDNTEKITSRFNFFKKIRPWRP